VKFKEKKEKKKKESKSDSEEEEEDEDEIPTFQPKLGSETIKYEKKKKIAIYPFGSNDWKGTALGTRTTKYSIKILDKCNNLMIGFAPKDIDKNGENNIKCGLFSII
jgi:hypothetical protein